jgi:hypothetical protein
MLLTACLHSGQHAVPLGGMQILGNYARAAYCRVPMLLAANAAGCPLHATRPKYIFYETTKIATGMIWLYTLWINLVSKVFMKSTIFVSKKICSPASA